MHRPKIGSVLIAAALAAATMIPMLASPSGAAVTTECSGGQYPNRVASESKLTVDCTAAAGTASNNIAIHDADDAVWHHGASRTVALTCAVTPCKSANPGAPWTANNADVTHAGSKVIKWTAIAATATSLAPSTPMDLRRPVSAAVGTAEVFPGGTYIVSVNATLHEATLSQAATLTETAITLKIEHTTNRVLLLPTCAAANNTITAPAGQSFTPLDLGKSVTGPGIPAGDYIDTTPAANSPTAHMAAPAEGTCTTGGLAKALIEIGAVTYVSGVAKSGTPNDPMSLQLDNTSVGGTGFSCSAAGKITMNAATLAETGGFTSNYIGLNVTVKKTVGPTTTTEPVGRITGITSSTATMTPTTSCPTSATTVVNSTNSQSATIGAPDAGAPVNGAAMMTLGAELNLSPLLVPTQDACTDGTLEGFMVVGGWENPGTGYGAINSGSPTASVGEILFPTSVISFNGWVVPHVGAGTETQLTYSDSNPHYTFSFPILPTGTAECTSSPGIPLSATGLEFTMNPITFSTAPFLPTGSGNIGDPSVRTLLPTTGTSVIVEQQINNTGPVENSKNTTTCTLRSLTDDPILGTGSACPTA